MKILKNLTSMILAIIMATSCLMVVNVVSTMAMTQNTRLYDWFGASYDYENNKGEYSNDRTIFLDAIDSGEIELASGATNEYWIYGKKYNLTYGSGINYQFKIVVPDLAVNSSFTMVAKSMWYSSNKLTLKKEDGTVVDDTKSLTTTASTVTYENLEAGETYTVTSYSAMSYSLLALNVTYNISGTGYNISGTVSDEDGNAIPRATVYIGEDTVARTDGDGNYAVEYMAGVNVDTTMKVTAVGYEDKEVPLSTTDDCTVDFTLSKKGTGSVYNYFMGSTDASNNYTDNTVAENAGLYQITDWDIAVNDKTISETTYNVGGSSYKLTTFAYKKNIQITIPDYITNAKFYMVAYGGYNYELLQNGVVLGEKTISDETGVISFDGLSTGVYNVQAVNTYLPFSLLVLEDKSSEIATNTNVTNSVTAVDNGLVSDIASDSPFADMATGLNSTDKLFTLVGVVNSERSSSQFANEINKVGFVLYDADVVDALGESAKTKNPQQLNSNYTASDFKDAVIQTDEVYKNFYDAENYNKDLDSDTEYTGATSQDSSSSKSYFAYVVALGEGKRYYAYPYTLYNGASQNTYDIVVNDKIEISNN